MFALVNVSLHLRVIQENYLVANLTLLVITVSLVVSIGPVSCGMSVADSALKHSEGIMMKF